MTSLYESQEKDVKYCIMQTKLGNLQNQPAGFKAFIPATFPPVNGFNFSNDLIYKADKAGLLMGKLDGRSLHLSNMDFLISMYIRKDATSSSQIEGTRATMIDAILAAAPTLTSGSFPADVDDILHYIDAVNYGIKELSRVPLSVRLIREIHYKLMAGDPGGARASHFVDPGNFRASQNWIGGDSIMNASFVPPPVPDMLNSMSDLEKFFHSKDYVLPLIKAGLIHAQFETIHPFLDGNGRVGRIIISLFLQQEKLLESPLLFLSSYFQKHQSTYYEKLNNYCDDGVEGWLDFFLDGVIITAEEAIITVEKTELLKQELEETIQSLGKASANKITAIMPRLYEKPIVNIGIIQQWTGLTRQGTEDFVQRLIKLKILQQLDETKVYGRSFVYSKYLNIFR